MKKIFISLILLVFAGFGGSVHATVACCYSGGECAEAITAQQCRNTGGITANAETCSPNPCGASSSAAKDILEEETITLQDLEVEEPSFLPSSPFYFFKNWGRGVRKFFTLDPVKKAELELKFADEKIAETKKLAETNPEKSEAIGRAVENYRRSQEQLKSRLESLRETSLNPNVDRLLEKITDRAVKHEKLFAELKEKFEEKSELKEKFDAAKDDIESNIAEAAKKDDAEKFARKLEKALLEAKGSDLKHVRSLELLDRFQKSVSEEVKEKLGNLRRDFEARLKEDLEEFVEKHEKEAPAILRETLEELPGDKARRLVIIEEIQERAEKRVREALKGTEKVLEKFFEEKEEQREHAAEAIEHAKERLIKLEARLGKTVDAPNAARRLFEEAKSHLEEAIRAFNDKKYGEAFGQARSAEVLARNALRLIEEQEEPEDEDLKEDMSELEERLNGWGKRMEALGEELRPKAKEALKNARLHLRLARESLEKGAIHEAEKHYEEAKKFERLLERLMREPSKKSRGEDEKPASLRAAPAAATPAPAAASEREKIACTQEYDPVCGANGKTYSNACHAKAAGVDAVSRGECGKSQEESRSEPVKEPASAPASITPSPEQSSGEPATVSRTAVETAQMTEFKIEADDNGFYPASPLFIPKGAKAKIHFLVRATNVYYGGIDFRSSKFKTETVKPGNTTSVEFTADEPFKVTSYWPLTDTPKAILTIEVK